MSMPVVRTRFAPSPTGAMHLGNVRAALFSALLAWQCGGRFLLRFEDSDAARSSTAAERSLLEGLRWLGLRWDEGPGQERPEGGARQSERGGVYDALYRRLREGGHAYPCFCSEATLERNRRAQRAAGRAPRYPGTCAGIDPAEAQRRLAAGEPASLRFRVAPARELAFADMVRGEQRFLTDDIGDFVIRRADGTPAFLFCNAVDDALMGVSHVLRGEDHVANTPRQLLLLEALGLEAPYYGHLPLILGDDGAPLSKRNGSRSLVELEEAGYLPTAILNYLFRLGHHTTSEELLSLSGMTEAFSVERLSRAPARFDAGQLAHWQRQAVARVDVGVLEAWLAGDDRVPADARMAFLELVRPNVSFPEDVQEWAGRLFGEPFVESPQVLREAGPEFFDAATAALDAVGSDWPALTAALRERTGCKGKALFLPLRVALTGVTSGPALGEALALMGSGRARQRLEAAARVAASGNA
ncbi:glutamate--tRNA ligase [Arhodomonas sp. SL1]|uniref:glutamate--tRNA ligase n=1 Tax=Arhodomonas sp. SL1 TaxID=3425691 RepID=UPI003F881258